MRQQESHPMKVRLEMEIDLQTGVYDVRFQNVTNPGDDIDLNKLSTVVTRVLDNVAMKTTEIDTAAPAAKLSVN